MPSAAGGPHGPTNVRTLRAIITRAQKLVGTSLRDSATVAGGLGEDELFENMRAFLLVQQIEPPVVDGILSGFAFFGSARGQAPAPAQDVPTSTDESDDDDVATPIANDDDEVSPGLDLPPRPSRQARTTSSSRSRSGPSRGASTSSMAATGPRRWT